MVRPSRRALTACILPLLLARSIGVRGFARGEHALWRSSKAAAAPLSPLFFARCFGGGSKRCRTNGGGAGVILATPRSNKRTAFLRLPTCLCRIGMVSSCANIVAPDVVACLFPALLPDGAAERSHYNIVHRSASAVSLYSCAGRRRARQNAS